ncbi:MAG: Succinyl-CoA:coenzyme A transferase [Syntrophaceae bacterium PtaU1.Bin231]|nr:MAG: Succinyl-CoA:coenzyme A transferase [Syntrophaceae bacterium PtaU1.Bin231]
MGAIGHWKDRFPGKFASEETMFGSIHRGDTIFIGSACAEPQRLVANLIRYVQSYPKAFFDTQVLSIRSLGVAPYATEKFKQNFRHNSFFIGDSVREAVNTGVADYTPIFLSQVPDLFRRGLARIDLDMEDIDYVFPYDEELLEYSPQEDDLIIQQIGKYVARLIDDGDTIQVGYGAIPNAILRNLSHKKELGVHSELISDGLIELMKRGVVDNTRKTIDRGKTVATFCMGCKETYAYIDDNPSVEFRSIDYTNHPLVIAQHDRMVAINSALEIDLTGQSTAESIGRVFYSGVGGQGDFMRGAVLARGGKSILALKSTAEGDAISRIVPVLGRGAGTTLVRGDVHYVVTEYGIAYLHGKSIRERAMALIAIAHPKFRTWLAEEAKKDGFIYTDQVIMPGERGRYPEELETYRKIKTGLDILFRPIKMTDESLFRDFLHNLSDQSLYRRFMSKRRDMPHERIQHFVVIDYTREMAIAAVIGDEARETIIGIGRYYIDPERYRAEVAFAVRDDYQNQGIGAELLSYLTYLAKREGLKGFTADVLAQNEPMLHVFEKGGFKMKKQMIAGIYELEMMFT